MRFRFLWAATLGLGTVYSQASSAQEPAIPPAPTPVESTASRDAATAPAAPAAQVPAAEALPSTADAVLLPVNEKTPEGTENSESKGSVTPTEPSRLGISPGQHLPPPAESLSNQQMADAIAQQLRQSGLLRQYNIDITFQHGVAELNGQVTDAGQRDVAVRIAQGMPGIARVVDRLKVGNSSLVVPTNATVPEPSVQAAPLPSRVPEPASMPRTGVAASTGNQPPEPTPIFQAPPSGFGMAPVPDPFMQPPRMPPYAWPTYAPYNNFSRVAYPTLYPYEAWPFIGPNYPFPKIPPGWRSITLEWKDGYWWYGKNATGHDWWRIRYW